MHKHVYGFCLLIIGFISCLYLSSATSLAIGQDVVISQVQLGDNISAKNELVELYNNSSGSVDITDWCLYYQSSSLRTEKLFCMDTVDATTRIILPGYSTLLSVSNELKLSVSPIYGDIYFSATLSGAAGYLFLNDADGNEVDKIGWGVVSDENNLMKSSLPGEVMSRKKMNANGGVVFQDTGKNSDDFEITLPKTIYEYGYINEFRDYCSNIVGIQMQIPDGYELKEVGNCSLLVADACPNIEGLQEFVPVNFGIDVEGNCVVDICPNLDNLQAVLPLDMLIDEAGNCINLDTCLNLPEVQLSLPDNYHIDEFGDCKHDYLYLELTELLPNVDGSDVGKEFIEIYNPNEIEIDLKDYEISVGDGESAIFYKFPVDAKIKAKEYKAFYNLDIKFSLKNSADIVKIYSTEKTLIDETVVYQNPKENESWAKIDNLWQYTNQVSPNEENRAYLSELKNEVEIEKVETCGPNQYRNPQTNRCNNLVVETVLKPCKEGQYRSEETNRCRSIVADVIDYVACPEGQERNPETNRCRKIITSEVLGETSLAPCPDGQERNPETNRCRNVVKSIPEADYKVAPVASGENNIMWWSIGGVLTVAVMYGIWEWRQEIMKLIKMIMKLVHLSK